MNEDGDMAWYAKLFRDAHREISLVMQGNQTGLRQVNEAGNLIQMRWKTQRAFDDSGISEAVRIALHARSSVQALEQLRALGKDLKKILGYAHCAWQKHEQEMREAAEKCLAVADAISVIQQQAA